MDVADALYLLFLALLMVIATVGAMPNDFHDCMRKRYPWPTRPLSVASSWLEFVFGMGGLKVISVVGSAWPINLYVSCISISALFVLEGAFRVAMVHNSQPLPSLLTLIPFSVFKRMNA